MFPISNIGNIHQCNIFPPQIGKTSLNDTVMFVVPTVSPCVNDSVAVLGAIRGADLVNDVGTLLLHALRALLLVDHIQNLSTHLLCHVPADLLECGGAPLVCHRLTLLLLHDVAGGVTDGGALPLALTGAGLLVDGVHHLVTLLLLVGAAGLAEAHTAPPVLDCLAHLGVVHLADLIIDGVALLVLHLGALVLVDCGAGGSS